MNKQKKKICRLCYYETVDTTDIFSKKGITFDYVEKIKKYLYFSVSAASEFRWLEQNNMVWIVF